MAQKLGRFEEIVLLAILQLRGNAYGVTIRRQIETKARQKTSYGAIYTTLERLERKGYVSSRKGEATAERGGRAKKYYRVEDAGLRALDDVHAIQGEMTLGLDLVLEPARVPV